MELDFEFITYDALMKVGGGGMMLYFFHFAKFQHPMQVICHVHISYFHLPSVSISAASHAQLEMVPSDAQHTTS